MTSRHRCWIFSELNLSLNLTAYVAREHQGLLLEKPFKISELLKQGCHLDINAELKLVDSIKEDIMLHSSSNSEHLEKTTMKKLGLKRFEHNLALKLIIQCKNIYIYSYSYIYTARS